MAAKVESDGKSNAVDPARLVKEIGRIEDAIEAKLSHKMAYVESCKPYNERIANAYEMAAKAADVPKAVLKAKIKEREHLRKAYAVADDFEDETLDTWQMISDALGPFGDLPLGQAAKDRAAKAEAARDAEPAAEAPKNPRGRPRKAAGPYAAPSSPEVAPEAPSSAPAEPKPVDPAPAALDPVAASDADSPAYKAGFDARMADDGGAIPVSFEGADRDRWHGGWLAADKHLADGRAAQENAERLRSGITPLH